MKTKREVLETYKEYGYCAEIVLDIFIKEI